MKKSLLIGIILAIYLALSGIVDVGLSYIAYQRDPEFFIDHEVTKEITAFFVKGEIPLLFIFIYLVCIFYVCLIVIPKFYKYEKYPKISKFVFYNFIILMIGSGLCHYLGGLSWFFYPVAYVVNSLQYLLITVTIVLVVYLVYQVIQEYKKEKVIPVSSKKE